MSNNGGSSNRTNGGTRTSVGSFEPLSCVLHLLFLTVWRGKPPATSRGASNRDKHLLNRRAELLSVLLNGQVRSGRHLRLRVDVHLSPLREVERVHVPAEKRFEERGLLAHTQGA